MNAPALQDLIAHNHCFGCGPGNERGLRICTAIAAAHFDAGRAAGKVCVTAEVDAVRVPESWMRACKVGP